MELSFIIYSSTYRIYKVKRGKSHSVDSVECQSLSTQLECSQELF